MTLIAMGRAQATWFGRVPTSMGQVPGWVFLMLTATHGSSGCINRYNDNSQSCDKLLSSGFTCQKDFCASDATCAYKGYCDKACGFCGRGESGRSAPSSVECDDMVPPEITIAYPELSSCDMIIKSFPNGDGCDGHVRVKEMAFSARVRLFCQRSCHSCCGDKWAQESGQDNFCSMLIAGGEYSCRKHFCKSCQHEFSGKCDRTCGLCATPLTEGSAVTKGRKRNAAAIGHVLTQLTSESLLADIRTLVELGSRYSRGSHREAANAAITVERLCAEASGGTAEVTRQSFRGLDPRQPPLYNVLARIQGSSNITILIGAHYDSTNNYGTEDSMADDLQGAPGADDNASGVAAVLACLRLLAKAVRESGWRPKYSILFAFFNAEEQGSIGEPFCRTFCVATI